MLFTTATDVVFSVKKHYPLPGLDGIWGSKLLPKSIALSLLASTAENREVWHFLTEKPRQVLAVLHALEAKAL
jgi:hypothetical protein